MINTRQTKRSDAMPQTTPRKGLLKRSEFWILTAGLIGIFGAIWLRESMIDTTPAIAAIRAVHRSLGSDSESVQISGRYMFEDVDGSSSSDVQLVCGNVGASQRRFAALAARRGRRSSVTFVIDELVFAPPPGRRALAREMQLLGACSISG